MGNRAITIDADGGTIIAGWTNRRVSSDGEISGVGKLTIANDSSSVRLTGANTYSGGTELQGTVWGQTDTLGTGDVNLNSVTAGRGHLKNYLGSSTHSNNIIIDDTNGGRLSAGWNSDLTLDGVVSGAGTLQVEGDSGTVVLAGANTHTGNIELLATNSVLKVTGSLGSGSYAGTISGDGTFEYAGSGTQVLTGDNGYTGTTTVSAGTLVINGDNSAAIGDVTVASGATLGGTGTVGGATTISGIHAPGNSPGVQTFNNGLTYDGATIEWELVSNTDSLGDRGISFDGIDVFGGLTFTNATALKFVYGGAVNFSDGFWALDREWLVFSGASSLTGNDSQLAFDQNGASPNGLFSLISKGDDNVYLSYTAVAVPEMSSLLMAAMGIGIAGVARRRQQHKSNTRKNA
ncbi:autotransporter-associated beta strand repeat-containing protein [Rubripirellula tenax]|uniref:autotransporter-associated beta strand repeat-containing protein n=1 Tax=Rubripirellula tenax TaxID=2528015 RepID=UPI0011B3AADC|nr:autotransporter-associated beta strand repeat-containing protein [Rubripirellula tenax]